MKKKSSHGNFSLEHYQEWAICVFRFVLYDGVHYYENCWLSKKLFVVCHISVVFVDYFTYKQNIPYKTICSTGNRQERKWLLHNY